MTVLGIQTVTGKTARVPGFFTLAYVNFAELR